MGKADSFACTLPGLAELLPLYALDALDEAEQVRVEAHLPGCTACRTQLASERETIADLALIVPRSLPPQGMRDRILANAQATPRLVHPRTEAQHRATHIADDTRPWFSMSAPRHDLTHAPHQPAWMLRRPPARLHDLSRRQALLLVAAALILVLLPWNIVLQARLTQQQATTRQDQQTRQALSAILASPQLVVYPLYGTHDPMTTGHVYIDPTSAHVAVVARGLPVLATDKTYQAWLNHDGVRTSVGFLRSSTSDIVLVGPLTQSLTYYQSLGVTIEPAGGSPHPTGPNVLLGKF